MAIARVLAEADLREVELVTSTPTANRSGAAAIPRASLIAWPISTPPLRAPRSPGSGSGASRRSASRAATATCRSSPRSWRLHALAGLSSTRGPGRRGRPTRSMPRPTRAEEFFATIERFNRRTMDDPCYGALLGAYGANLIYPRARARRAAARQLVGADQPRASEPAAGDPAQRDPAAARLPRQRDRRPRAGGHQGPRRLPTPVQDLDALSAPDDHGRARFQVQRPRGAGGVHRPVRSGVLAGAGGPQRWGAGRGAARAGRSDGAGGAARAPQADLARVPSGLPGAGGGAARASPTHPRRRGRADRGGRRLARQPAPAERATDRPDPERTSWPATCPTSATATS